MSYFRRPIFKKHNSIDYDSLYDYDDYSIVWDRKREINTDFKPKYRSNNFNWGGYYNFYEPKELCIIESEGYITPTEDEVRIKYKGSNNEIKQIQNLARYFSQRYMELDNYIDPKFEEKGEKYVNEANSYRNIISTIDSNIDSIQGFTPLEKAIFVVKYLFDNTKSIQVTANELENQFESIKNNGEIFDYIDEFNNLREEFNKENLSGLLKKLSLIQNFGIEFEVGIKHEWEDVECSLDEDTRLLEDIENIINCDIYQLLMPDFQQKLVTNNLTYRQPVIDNKKKQCIILAVDFSGSMSTREKVNWVNAIIFDRIRYAIKEEAEIYVCFYSDKLISPYNNKYFHKINNYETALEFWKKIIYSPRGGDTNVGNVSSEIIELLKLGSLDDYKLDPGLVPEILFVTDGQDTPKSNRIDHKINAVTLIDYCNHELQQLCLNNDGKYIHIEGDQLLHYTKNGIESHKL